MSGCLPSARASWNAAPDGYALLFALASNTVTPFLVRKLPYDAARSFTPITPVLITITE